MFSSLCSCGWEAKDKVASRLKKLSKDHEKKNPYHLTRFMRPNTPLPNFPDIKEIKDRAEEKLEAQQIERSQLEHSLASDYLALCRLVGREEAERFWEETKSLVF